jgi:hypothetical protein
MAAGSMAGGMMAKSGADAAGATAANAGRIAQDQLVDAGEAAAQGAYQNAQSYLPWMVSGQNALANLSSNDPNDMLGRTLMSPGYQLTRPYLDAYGQLLDKAHDTWGLDKFETSPGYQFRLDEGRNALANSGSARGMTMSGAQAKALTNYNQGAASDEYSKWMASYQDWLSRYGNYTGMAGNALSGLAQQTTQNEQWLANLGFNATKGAVDTNMKGNDYSFAGYNKGVPMWQEGQNALASSQAAGAASMAKGVSGAANAIGGAVAGMGGGGGGLFGMMNSAGGAGTDRGTWA